MPVGIVLATSGDPTELILRNCVNPDSLEDPVSPVEAILSKCDHQQVFTDAIDI